MGLEFLQADADIAEFVIFLYEQGYLLSHSCREKRDIVMDRDAAIHELQYDLHTGFSSYYICDSNSTRILALDSCDPQAHPSKLGGQGRRAGVIGHLDKDNPVEKELMRRLRNYFRRTYKFQRYNGAARMSCHFGPHYQQMEAEFFDDSRAADLCTGYLSLICCAGRAELEQERVFYVFSQLDIQNVEISIHPYWGAPGLVRLHIPFLYYAPSFSVDGYSSVLSELSFDGRVRLGSSNFVYRFQNGLSPDALSAQPEGNCIYVILQRPW